MTSILNVDTIAAKNGTSPVGLLKQHATKAWATLDADASTVVGFETFNVSSVSDDATGKYGITYTNNMNTATYLGNSAVSYHSTSSDFDRYISGNFGGGGMDARRTSSETKIGYYDTSFVDTFVVGASINGDLA